MHEMKRLEVPRPFGSEAQPTIVELFVSLVEIVGAIIQLKELHKEGTLDQHDKSTIKREGENIIATGQRYFRHGGRASGQLLEP